MRKKALSSIVAIILSFVLVFSVVGCTTSGGNISLSQTEATMGVGDILTLRATTDDNSKVEWTSSDETVATVVSGMVTAKKIGEATITATSESAGSATCKIKVVDYAVSLDKTTATVERGQEIKLTASTTMNGTPVENDKYVWSSDDPSIATVSDGTVKGVREGTTKITVRRQAGTTSATCDVTVIWTNKPEGYYEIGHFEQNKVLANTWGRWANQGWEGGGRINMNLAEYQDAADSEAGVASFNFTVETHGTLAGADLQVVYRSAGQGGKLTTGNYYSLTADVTSSVAGDITLNGTDFTLEANKKTTVTSYFLHEDDGTIYPEGVYDNIYYTAVFLLLGNLGEVGETVDFKIEKLQWKEFTPAELLAPTVSVAEKKATIADTNPTGVKEYTIGFFRDADATAPVYTMKHAVKGENTIKDDIFENGTYVVRAMALGTDARYLQSAWSAANDVTFTVNNEHVSYDLAQGTEAEAIDDAGRYYYSGNLTEGKYLDGTITFNIPMGGNWYDNQLFFENGTLTSGARYTLSFDLKVSGLPELPAGITAWKIRVNGTMFEIENGDNQISVPYTESASGGQDGSSMHIQFGEPSSDFSDTIATVTGAFEMSNIKWEEVKHAYTPGPMDTDTAAEAACDGTWLYWASQGEGNCTVTATEVTSSYDEATDTYGVTAKFSSAGETLAYGFQVFHNDSVKFPNGTNVKVTLTIKATTALTLTIDGKTVNLVANEAQDVEVTRTVNYTGDWQGATLFGMSVNCTDGLSTELTLTNIKFEAVGAPAPSEHPKAEDYDLGEAITPTGTELIEGGEQDIQEENYDKWYYWAAKAEWGMENVDVSTHTVANGTITLTYQGGNLDYSLQLFYKTSAIDAAKQYFLTVTVETDKPIHVGLHGETYDLTAGTHTLTAIKPASGTALSIQFRGVSETTTVKVSNVKWQEIKTAEQPEPQPTEGFAFGEEKNIRNGWAFWNDQDWAGAAVEVTESSLTPNSDGSFTVSMKYNCTKGGSDFGLQIFHNSPDYATGKQYTLTLTATAKTDCKITINGTVYELKANTPQQIELTFLYNFDANSESTQFNTSLFDMQAKVEAGQSYELTLENMKWTAAGETAEKSITFDGVVLAADNEDAPTKVYVGITINSKNYTVEELKTAVLFNDGIRLALDLQKSEAGLKENGVCVLWFQVSDANLNHSAGGEWFWTHLEISGKSFDGGNGDVQFPEGYAAGTKTYTVGSKEYSIRIDDETWQILVVVVKDI